MLQSDAPFHKDQHLLDLRNVEQAQRAKIGDAVSRTFFRDQKKQHADIDDLTGIVFDWEGIAALASKFTGGAYVFRGQAFPHALRPSIGRSDTRKDALKGVDLPFCETGERWIFDQFKLRSRPYLAKDPATPFEWLAIAQHHRMPTRLLDWTESFLAAVYFAVDNAGSKGPAAIYAMSDVPLVAPQDDPFTINEVKLYRPPHITPRIPAQQGVFTVHPEPNKPFKPAKLEQWLIDPARCFNIKKQLHTCGINASVLFPDIDGLAGYLGWRYKRSGSVGLS